MNKQLSETNQELKVASKDLSLLQQAQAKSESLIEQLNKQLDGKSEEIIELVANLKASEKDLGALQGQVDALSEQLASQKVSHYQLQGSDATHRARAILIH